MAACFLVVAIGSVRGENFPLLIEFFRQAGCGECEKIEAFVLPALKTGFPDQVRVMEYDIGQEENFLKLVRRQDQLGYTGNAAAAVVVNRMRYLGGFEQVDRELFPLIRQMLADGVEGIAPEAADEAEDGLTGRELVRERAASFTIWAVALAGLIDGINPCVFATLVFFLSLLSVSGIRGRKLLLAGSTYCAACFLSYIALGLGLFRFLKLLSGYRTLQTGLEWLLIGVLLLFAFLSFRDAWRFRRSGKGSDVTLQLPDKIKNRIHSVMRRGLKYRFLIPGTFAIGVLVTALESVCTGQVYVPTLMLMTREAGTGSRWFLLLLLYNFMFILPLLFLFAAAWRGVSTSVFLRWSKQNVVYSKIGLGLFFLLMTAMMLVLL